MNAVHDMMSTSPVTVGPMTSIGNLLALFDRHDFNAFPVVDHGNRLVGIISKLDVLRLLVGPRGSTPATDAIATTYVAGVMRRKVVFVGARESITAAGNLMVATKLRSLPVIERREGRSALVGMLSRGDVVRWLRSQLVEGRYVRQEKASLTSLLSFGASARPQDNEARNLECREGVESFIDEISEQSFPASDPPAWGTASSRLEQAVWCPPTEQK
jgi:CBS domain-containing protein